MKFFALLSVISFTNIQSINSNSLSFCVKHCVCIETTVNCLNASIDKVPTVSAESLIFDLRFNRIRDLNANAFRHLSLLTTLLLNNNEIQRLTNHLFAGLARLKHLHLDNNQITRIDEKCFKNLHNLENLYLNDNKIHFISDKVFSDLPSLQRVFLQNNDLIEINPKLFKSNTNLREISLENNGLVCNCQLLWLKQLSSKLSVLKASCDSPKHLKDKSFTDLSVNELKCKAPEISEDLKAFESTSPDKSMELHCKVTGDPEPIIEWLYNNKTIDIKQQSNYYSLSRNGSKLLIRERSKQIEGNYRCIARNTVGVMGSQQIFVGFSDKKSNKLNSKTKTKQIIKSFGNTLQLNCSQNNSIFWTKDNSIINFTESNNRLKISTKGSLLIKSLLPFDSGFYKCFNHYNQTIGVFEVKISTPPVFTDISDSVVEVDTGSNVKLKCFATGFPEPVIQWTRKERSDFKVIRNELKFENIKPSDEDIYRCNASNSVGMAVKEVRIKVKGGDIQLIQHNFESNDVFEAFNEAKDIVDLAINTTLRQINDKNYRNNNPSKLLSIARFPLLPGSIEFAKSVEIYEKSLEILKRKAESKSRLPSNAYKYEALLSPNQLNILAHLSGCLVGHRTHSSQITNCSEECVHKSYRSYDGVCNNMRNQLWGASLTPFQRLLPPQYEDGLHLPIGWFEDKKYNGFAKPNPRKVCQQVVSTKKITPDPKHSHMLMQHGQFLDHDIDFSMPSISFNTYDREPIDCSRTCRRVHPCFSIEIPLDDIRRNHTKSRQSLRGTADQNCIELIRSSASCGSGLTSVASSSLMPREQVNQLTAFIDASNVYGNTVSLANHLRDKLPRDSGKMRSLVVNGRQYLPLNEARLPNDCQQDPRRSDFGCFLAGDFRANEQLGLLAMHTLWLREHNRIADKLRQLNPLWSGEQVYQESRKIVGAQMQFITYYHWLPHILGPQGMTLLGEYKGYNDKVNPSVANVFATAALRFGHTLINPFLLRLNETYGPTTKYTSHLSLHKTFFAPHRLVEEGGIDPLLRGLLFGATKSPRSDQVMNDQLTEHLFHFARDISLDLGSLNIQRGRDHGIPDYNLWRKYCGLGFAHSFHDFKHQIKSNKIRNKLQDIYGNPNNIDLWIGAVSEDIIESAKVGPTFRCLLVEQFRRLRDGDRFYFEKSGVFTSDQLNELKKSSLGRVICDNSDNITTITSDVFTQPKHQIWRKCHELSSIDLNKWHNSLIPESTCSNDNELDFQIPVQLLNQLRNG